MKKAIKIWGRVCYHDGFPLHIKKEGIIIPFHVFRKEETFPYTFSNLAPLVFPPRPNLIGRRKGNPVHCKGMSIGRSPHDIDTGIP